MTFEQEIKVKNFKHLNRYVEQGGILFTGSSLMEQFPVCEFCEGTYMGRPVYNRGIGGFTTDDFWEYIHEMLLDIHPSEVFLNIGTNDIKPMTDCDWKDHLLENYEKILVIANEKMPGVKIHLMAYYPVNNNVRLEDDWARDIRCVRNNENIELINQKIKELAYKMNCSYTDLNQGLTDNNGNLKEEYTFDGIHMYADAYRIVFDNLIRYLGVGR